jgi:hypothetical protein
MITFLNYPIFFNNTYLTRPSHFKVVPGVKFSKNRDHRGTRGRNKEERYKSVPQINMFKFT